MITQIKFRIKEWKKSHNWLGVKLPPKNLLDNSSSNHLIKLFLYQINSLKNKEFESKQNTKKVVIMRLHNQQKQAQALEIRVYKHRSDGYNKYSYQSNVRRRHQKIRIRDNIYRLGENLTGKWNNEIGDGDDRGRTVGNEEVKERREKMGVPRWHSGC